MRQLMLSAQASHTDIKPPLLATNNYSSFTNMRQPASFGVTLGMTHLLTKLGCLSTKVTFRHRYITILIGSIFVAKIPLIIIL